MAVSIGASIYADYSWYKLNNALEIFWTLFFTKFNIHLTAGIIFAAIFIINVLIMKLWAKDSFNFEKFFVRFSIYPSISPRLVFWGFIIALTAVLAYFAGSIAASRWQELFLYSNRLAFDGFPKDPVFNNDISYYFFSLPVYLFATGWLIFALILPLIFSILLFITGNTVRFNSRNLMPDVSSEAKRHLSFLSALIFIVIGIRLVFKTYSILNSQMGKFYGAGNAAVNAGLNGYYISAAIAFIAAAALIVNIFRTRLRVLFAAILVSITAFMILNVFYPAIYQRLSVDPNELDREKPYIENNIKFTRIAYGIDKIKEVEFANNLLLDRADIDKNRETIDSIRLWDWKPLKQTYKQLQELKPYYHFNDVDIDRYMINGKKVAVNIAPRELSTAQLPEASATWTNMHLIYTHGYGITASRVDKVTTEGLPELIIRDIPPVTPAGLEIKVPQIYYGEHRNDYIITNTTIKPGEFDYPSGESNQYTTYSGKGGVKLDSFFKRLLFAVHFSDINILISGSIGDQSRIHYTRNIVEMARNFLPFVVLDNDPYMVISNGKLYWMMDAYTVSGRFPYSTPVIAFDRELNYIRNSVKFVIDAYDGTIDCYISDKTDPLITIYSKLFPKMFKNIGDMPEDLRSHVRYPEDMYNIQAQMLLRYHVSDPVVFYNNEDTWHKPLQVYENVEQEMESMYLVSKLPGEQRSEFNMFLPFTPYNKNNMIAFLSAKCDQPNYGELKLYRLPKDRLTYGPMQIEARINQDPEISKQVTLWSQKGSKVSKGNMLAFPINESILYISPLYIKAENSEMPELKRVIVSFGDSIVMEESLQSALDQIFSGKRSAAENPANQIESTKELAREAYTHYTNAENFLKSGDWGKYGEELNKLKEILQRLSRQ
jgi:uncharacterized protein